MSRNNSRTPSCTHRAGLPSVVLRPARLRCGLILRCSAIKTGWVTEREVDEYLAAIAEPKRGTLEQLRKTILEIVPDAEQCISYGMPAFRQERKGRCRLCRLQRPPQLPPAQRVGPARTGGRPRWVYRLKGSVAVHCRQASSQSIGEEAHRGEAAAARTALDAHEA